MEFLLLNIIIKVKLIYFNIAIIYIMDELNNKVIAIIKFYRLFILMIPDIKPSIHIFLA